MTTRKPPKVLVKKADTLTRDSGMVWTVVAVFAMYADDARRCEVMSDWEAHHSPAVREILYTSVVQ